MLNAIWRNLIGSSPSYSQDVTQVPLLATDGVNDLRRQALELMNPEVKTKPVLHKRHGEHLSPRRGYGLDYEESRVYQSGDEVRFMNWRLAARSGELHVKVFREERQPSTFILLDWRGSMRFGTRVRIKAAQALRAAVLLAFYNHYSGRLVSGLVADTDMHWIESSNDETGIFGMVGNINRVCPPLPPGAKQLPLENVLRAMHSALAAGTTVYLISDFVDADSSCRSVLARLAAEHDINAIHIIDPAEQQLPKAGYLRLNESEKGLPPRQVDFSNPYINAQYHSAAIKHLDQREALVRGLGINYVRLLTLVDDIKTQLGTI